MENSTRYEIPTSAKSIYWVRSRPKVFTKKLPHIHTRILCQLHKSVQCNEPLKNTLLIYVFLSEVYLQLASMPQERIALIVIWDKL